MSDDWTPWQPTPPPYPAAPPPQRPPTGDEQHHTQELPPYQPKYQLPPPNLPPPYQQPLYQQPAYEPDLYGRRPPPRRRGSAMPALIGALIALLVVLGAGGGWLLTHRNKHAAAAPTPSSTTATAAPTFPSPAVQPSTAHVTVTVTPSSTPAPTHVASTSPASTTTPDGIDVSAVAGNPFAPAVGSMFATYFGGINAHDGSIVNTVLYHKVRVSTYEKAIRTTTDDEIAVLSLQPDTSSSSDLISEVTFRSAQAPELGPDGENCTLWNNIYRLRKSHGRYQIVKSEAIHHSC